MPAPILRLLAPCPRAVLIVVLPFIGALACRAPEAEDGAAPPRAPRRASTDTLWVVQLGAFKDSARAAAVADSLGEAGWGAFTSGRLHTPAGPQWKLRIMPTASRALADHAAAAAQLLSGQLAGAVVTRSPVPDHVHVSGAELIPVNSGSHGAMASVRWMRSPDGRAIIVMEDPAAIEAEPVPNGVVLANEATGRLVQVEQVWDAAPSPDWSRLAVSWAFVLQGDRSPTISRERWIQYAQRLPDAFARQMVPLPQGTERATRLGDILGARAFRVSDMGVAYGLGLAQVIPVDQSGGGTHVVSRNAPPDRRVLRVDAWRLRWMRNGNLAVGTGIKGTQELSPPARWIAVHPDSGRLLGLLADTLSFAPAAWVQGPTMDPRAVHDLPTATMLDAVFRRFETRDGWLRVIENSEVRVIGAGIPLATTKTGRFVVALAPVATSDDGQPMRLVVYRVP